MFLKAFEHKKSNPKKNIILLSNNTIKLQLVYTEVLSNIGTTYIDIIQFHSFTVSVTVYGFLVQY